MLYDCMLEYLKGKAREQEKKGCPLSGYQRSASFDPQIH